MNIVIVEDEAMVAKRIARFIKDILAEKLVRLDIYETLSEAKNNLFSKPVDLLFLDLNLNGKDGFELLQLATSGSFQTVIISAYEEKAIKAFEYGVIDFVGKPFTKDRLKKAIGNCAESNRRNAYPTKYISVRTHNGLKLIHVDDISHFKGAGVYVDICLKNGKSEIHDKSLEKLSIILPKNFIRIHKSYIINLEELKEFHVHNSSKIECELSTARLPVSRFKYRELKKTLNQSV